MVEIMSANEDDRFYFSGAQIDLGGAQATIHSGYGKIEGKDGDDIIVFGGAKKGPDGLELTLDGGAGNDNEHSGWRAAA
jgi:hypothetical protein